jgi:Rrf2 family iron-sulfur cluster assembly transcriptional regulator
MYEIAKGSSLGPVTIKRISEEQHVSVAYLEQILNKLRRAGIIKSVKGPGGGYMLARDPKLISIGEILNELEGPVAITSCLDPKEGCIRVDSCVTHLLWKSLGDNIKRFLDGMKLQDLLQSDQFVTVASKNGGTDKKGLSGRQGR